MKKDIKYIIKRILIGVGIILILSFINSCQVYAETISFEDHNGIIYYNPAGNDISNTRQNTLYYNSSSSNPASIYVPVELLSTADYPVVFNGKYLIDFYIYGVGTFYQEYNCSNFTSNFRYINLTTGNWISSSDKIKSNCVSVNKTKYNGYDSIHILYSFTLNTDNNVGATEFSFQITKYNFFTALSSGTNIGYSIGNLYDYDVDIVDSFNNGAKLEDISDSINNSSQNIINNQNQNTNSITNSISGATQQAIENANQNTDKEIESQQVCKYIDKVSTINDHKYLNINGVVVSANSNWGVTDYFSINNTDKIKVLKSDNSNYVYQCFYNLNKTKISCISNNNLVLNNYINIPDNSSYVRFTIQIDSNQPQFEICRNGNQAMNDSINDLNNNITDSSIPSDSESKINNITSLITQNQNSNIVQLATFFPQLLQMIINGMNTNCTGGYSLGSLYGTQLTIPCINPVDYLGATIWGTIDAILCLCYLIPLCKFLVNKYNDLTSLKNLRWG